MPLWKRIMNMASLRELAASVDDLVRPFGEIEVLLFYGLVAPYLTDFLHGREIASKIWLPKGNIPNILKRGSKDKPLYIEDFVEAVTPEFLEARQTFKDLKNAKSRVTEKQALVWSYFVRRKLIDFFYATNKEGEGRDIDRIFFDIDRGEGTSPEDALEVARLLVQAIQEDEDVQELVKGDPFVAWTGGSFHVFLALKHSQPTEFYDKYFEYSTRKPKNTLTERWVAWVKKKASVELVGGHEKVRNALNIDPSQTPSGKLCRVPLGSLHMRDAKTVDGVSIPLTLDMLEKNIIKELESYTPRRVLDELPELARRLPS